jgi:hypothetical protein
MKRPNFHGLMCAENLRSRNLKLRKRILYLHGVLFRTTENEPEMWEDHKQKNQDSTLPLPVQSLINLLCGLWH